MTDINLSGRECPPLELRTLQVPSFANAVCTVTHKHGGWEVAPGS
jgi:hypothetical protein